MKDTDRPSFIHVVTGVVILSGLYFSSLYSYLLFHTLSEMFSIVVAFGIFIIGWNSKDHIKNNYLLFLAVAYLFIAFLDLLHTMSYKGMGIFRDYDYYANQLWIATRYLESLSIFVAFYFIQSKRDFQPQAVMAGYAALTALIVSSIFWWHIFPVCFVEGQGLTQFKKISEYIICCVLLADILILIRMKSYFDRQVHRWLVWSLILTISSELAFTFYISNYGLSNLIGHYFKIFSFYLIYKALVETGITKPHAVMFHALQDSESKYRDLVESSADFIWAVDSDGNYTYASPLSLKILGHTPERMIGRSLFSFMPPADGERMESAFRKAVNKNISLSGIESHYVHADGHVVTLETNGLPIEDESGEVIGFRGVDRDISDRKQLEKLQEQVRQIMQHDLKTPLSGIISLPQIIKDEEGLSPDHVQILEMIEDTGRRMLRMIDNQLDIFKIETGTYQYCPEDVDLIQVFSDAASDLHQLCSDKNVELQLYVNGEDVSGPCIVPSNRDLLFSMLSNLLTNAVEASPYNSDVLISIDEEKKVICIRNHGAVPFEVRDIFFEKFKTFGKVGGTGLGTYSAKIMANAMGYGIDLDVSDIDDFTSILITIPNSADG